MDPRPLALSFVLLACSGAPAKPVVETVTIPAGPVASASAATAPAADAAKLSEELDRINPAVLGALGGGGEGIDLTGSSDAGATALNAGLRPGVGGPGAVGNGGGGLPGTGKAPLPMMPAGGTVPGPKANVSIGGAALSGGAVAGVSAVVAGMAAGFRRCLNKALLNDPGAVKAGASVRLLVKIGTSGEVLSVTPSGATGLAAPAIACMAGRVSSAQFSPPDSGSATLVIPVSAQVNP